MKARNLYKVVTRGCGTFYVVAGSFDAAQARVYNELNDSEYGYSNDRVVTMVHLIRRENIAANGKHYFHDENDLDKFLIVE